MFSIAMKKAGHSKNISQKLKGKQKEWKSYIDARLSVVVAVLSIIAAAYISLAPADNGVSDLQEEVTLKSPPNIAPGWFDITDAKPLNSYNLTESIDKVMKTMVKDKPAIIKAQSLLKDWPIFQWDLLKISRKRQNNSTLHLENCRLQAGDGVFVLGREREKGGMLGSRHDTAMTYINSSLAEFLNQIFNDKIYLYWAGELKIWEDFLGASQACTKSQCWESFKIIDEGLRPTIEKKWNESAALWKPMLWLSHPGVVASTHYDTQHNIFIQVMGEKRFILFPPETELYSYPNIHRSYRQSQVRLETPRVSNASEDFFKRINPSQSVAYEVIVKPGDVLYIPPYWQHRVESTSLAVSLSILSPSEVETSLAEIYWEQVPFGGRVQESRSMRILAVSRFLNTVLIGVNEDLRPFAEDLYTTRYAPLYDRASLSVFPEFNHSTGSCTKDVSLIKPEIDLIETQAFRISDMLQAVNTSKAIKRIFLRDYAEQLSRWAVGPQYTPFFIKRCLL